MCEDRKRDRAAIYADVPRDRGDVMRDAKDYKNTVEFAAENLQNRYGERYNSENQWDKIDEHSKELLRDCVGIILDTVNYFEGKTCSDCGYFDPTDNICFGEDREHKEQADNPICETFAPKGLVEVTTP